MRIEECYGEVIALDFDLACTTRLLFYDLEREKRMTEALGLGHFGNALSETGTGTPPGFDTSNANYH